MPRNSTTLKILILEDQLIIAADICVQLSKLGYTIIGINCRMVHLWQMIKSTAPDIILMNIGVKEKTARIAGVRTLMQEHHIPVILLSSNLDPPTFKQLIELRPYAFIPKPFDAVDLQQGIAFARRRMAAEAEANRSVCSLSPLTNHSDDESNHPDN